MSTVLLLYILYFFVLISNYSYVDNHYKVKHLRIKNIYRISCTRYSDSCVQSELWLNTVVYETQLAWIGRFKAQNNAVYVILTL